MKIAIMTQPLGKNYGGIMQAWALQQVLKRMGHEVVTIDRQPDQPGLAYKAARLAYRAGMKAIGKRKAPINLEKHLPTILQHTQRFIDQHLTMSEPLYSTQQLRDHFDRENYDAVIVGSDQTWRPKYSPKITNFFLDFLETKPIRKIAYATSFGVDNWEFDKNTSVACKHLAQKFKAISVREKSGAALCSSFLGIDAQVVLDPTLLLTTEAYQSLLPSSHPLGNGIYTYILDKSPEKTSIIQKISSQLGLPTFNHQAARNYESWTCNTIAEYQLPPIYDWLSGFQRAKFVITDSFHGMVFSIIFKKPFLVIPNDQRGSTRFQSLLSTLNLEDQILPSTKHSYPSLKKEVDWLAVDNTRETESKKSVKFLSDALQ